MAKKESKPKKSKAPKPEPESLEIVPVEQERQPVSLGVPVTPAAWQMIQSIAPVAQAARMYGVTQEQAAIVMLTGYELGLGLTASFKYIHLIKTQHGDQPSLAPQGALALIYRSGELESLEIDEQDDESGRPWSCTVTMKRTNGLEYTAYFTMDDAERAGLVKPDGAWEKYPRNMLKWRAVGFCADIVFPDTTGGLKRPDEYGVAVDAAGMPLLDLSFNKPQPSMTLDDLMQEFTPQEILEAAGGGVLPSTPAEYEEIAAILRAAKAAGGE